MKRILALFVVVPVLSACLGSSRPKGGLEPLPGLSNEQVQEALFPKRLALVVGINTFKDNRWPPLKHAVNDANELGKILEDPKKGHFDQVEILSDPNGTNLKQIEEATERLLRQNKSPDDTVLVYFSTHGTLARDPDGVLTRFLVTTDSDQDRIRDTAFKIRSLEERFERLPSKKKALILASCHSGSGKSALPQPIAGDLSGIKGAFFVRPLQDISQASMILTACAWGETAREDDTLGHDIYTNFFLQALQAGDADGDGAVTASEAHAYALEKTYAFSKGRQRPQVESSILGVDPIILSGQKERPGQPTLFSFLAELDGFQVAIDGREKGSLPSRLLVDPGSHRVVIRNGDGAKTFLDQNVTFDPGEELAVEKLLEKRKRTWLLQAHGGYQQFFDEETQRSLVRPTPILGISIAKIDFPWPGFECSADLSAGGGRQRLDVGGLGVNQDLYELSYGLALRYRIDLEPFSLFIGPRLAGVHLFRRGVTPGNKSQDFFNLSPGIIAGVRFHFAENLFCSAEARTQFFSVKTEKESVNLGYLDLTLGLGLGL
jgi:hypothetical protein